MSYELRVRYGTTRTAFLIGKWAVKVPAVVEWRLFLHGLLANMTEKTFGTMDDPRFALALCPVKFSVPGGFLIVMPRCEDVTVEDYEKHLVELMDWPVPVENKVDSVGWLEGRIVAVDYGN